MIVLMFLLACAEQRCAEACGTRGYTYQSGYFPMGGGAVPAVCACGSASPLPAAPVPVAAPVPPLEVSPMIP
jgi:hypothetical protein